MVRPLISSHTHFGKFKNCPKFYGLFCFFCCHPLGCFEFKEFDKYQYQLSYAEVDQKIASYLEKDREIQNFYHLTPDLLYVGDLKNQQIDYVLYLRNDKLPAFERPRIHKGLQGAKIAIDPGHFGGAFAELEERFIKVPAEKTRNGEAIYFAEGDLTFLTALELQKLLEAEGAIVFVTRNRMGQGVLGEDLLSRMGKFPNGNEENSSKTFRTHFNTLDLHKRAEMINAFAPHISVIIHYNAQSNTKEQDAAGFFNPSNFNLAFVPGAFGSGELNKEQDRYEFLRLLLTDTIEESLKLSGFIVRQFVNHLNVPLITENDSKCYIPKFCILQEPGVYSRNLALTRLVHSPLCYGETLIQNNEEEAYRLAGPDSHGRIKEVAKAYYEGIKQYLCSED